MRVLFTALLILLTGDLSAHASTEADRIQGVISAQIEAFRKDDRDAAFAIATPEIQAKFRDAANFMRMVAGAYPQVYRPRNVVFLDLVEGDARLVQRVLITGPEGRAVLALYEMQKIDGAWRINGCVLTAPPEKEI